MSSTKKKKNRLRLHKLFCLVIFAVMLGTALPRMASIARLYEQKEELVQQKKLLLQEYDSLYATERSMENPETIEKLAREKLGMVKEGERLMVEGKDEPQNLMKSHGAR